MVDDIRSLFDEGDLAKDWAIEDWQAAKAKTRQLFEPRSPIDQDTLFSGRITQVQDLLDVVYEKGAHAIIYGERGVGKTSLANIISGRVPSSVKSLRFLKDNCRPEDSFFDLWSKMLFDFQHEGTSISDLLGNESRHFIVQKILESLDKSKHYVFIFDEFDRITDPATKSAMADTIKHFSDYPQNITIVIVGVGFSIFELFGAHPSIERCCKQIQMPRMSHNEISQIIIDRTPEIGISASAELIDTLVGLAQGFPGFGHLLGREAVLSAISRRQRSIDANDINMAISKGVDKAQESMRLTYQTATYSAKENIYSHVLLACAKAKKNEMGLFSASDVKDELSPILGRPVEIGNFARHLSAFCDENRGPVLRKTGKPKRYLYQFIEAPIQPFIIMIGKRDGLI
jgi:Cdc6-like AAA superfamily ATPase